MVQAEWASCNRFSLSSWRLQWKHGPPLPHPWPWWGCLQMLKQQKSHTRVSRMYSFFEKSNLLLQDILLIIKSYLEKNSPAQCSRFSYTTTAVNRASYIREEYKEHFYTNQRHRKLWGIVEIDEYLYGRRVKVHHGNPNRGIKVTHFQISIVLLLNFIFHTYLSI